MKLLYATSITYPSPYANRMQTVAMATAFAAILSEKFMLAGASLRDIPAPHSDIRKGPSPVLALRYVLRIRKEGYTHVFTREERLLAFMLVCARLLRLQTKFFLECHTLPLDPLAAYAMRNAHGLVTVTAALADDLAHTQRIPRSRILVAHDAVAPDRFAALPSRSQARAQLGIDADAMVIAYTGSFGARYPWKGVDVLLDSVAHADADWRYYLVGGTNEEIAALRARYRDPRIALHPHRAQEELPLVLAAADVLVLPNKRGYVHAERHTSPLKLFEYLASGVPMLVSDLPSVREVVTEDEVAFFEPNDPLALADGIRAIFADPERAHARAVRAQALAREHTWDARAAAIISFMDTV